MVDLESIREKTTKAQQKNAEKERLQKIEEEKKRKAAELEYKRKQSQATKDMIRWLEVAVKRAANNGEVMAWTSVDWEGKYQEVIEHFKEKGFRANLAKRSREVRHYRNFDDTCGDHAGWEDYDVIEVWWNE